MVLTDNFGFLLSAFFPINGTVSPDLKQGMIDITGTPQEINIKGSTSNNTLFERTMAGNFVQIGKGSTLPTKQDFNIENPFTNGGVEDNMQPTGIGGFVFLDPRILYTTQINPTAGTGGIREVCYFLNLVNSSAVTKTFLMWRDVIPLVSFIAGQSITIDNEVTI